MSTSKFFTVVIISFGILFFYSSCSYLERKQNISNEKCESNIENSCCGIPFEIKDSRIIVRAKLNNVVYANLLVDNGCYEPILSKVFLDKHKDSLHLVHHSSILPIDHFPAYPNLKRSLAQGSLSYCFGDSVFQAKNTSAYGFKNKIIDEFAVIIESDKYDMFYWPLPEGVDGIMPLKSLAKGKIIKINFEKQCIQFCDKPDFSANAYPYELKNKQQIIQIPLSIKTRKKQEEFVFSAFIDLGFSGGVEFFKTPVVSKAIPKIKNYTQNVECNYDATKITPLFFRELFFDNILVRNARFLYQEKNTNETDMIIGNTFLNNFDLYFDYENRIIYMKPYQKSFSDVKDTVSIMSGVIIQIEQKGDCNGKSCSFTYKYNVFGIVAEQIKADFKLNDEILKFGNISTARLSRSGFTKLKGSIFEEATIKRGNDTIVLHLESRYR